MMKTRKKRSDRNHVVYCITNNITGEQYVGITALSYKGNVKRTLYRRMQKHYQRAMTETKGWALCENLRTYGAESFTFGVLEVIRGKSQAHARETEIINSVRPALNTFQSRASM